MSILARPHGNHTNSPDGSVTVREDAATSYALSATSIAVLSLTLAGNTWGFGRQWSAGSVVTKFPVLR